MPEAVTVWPRPNGLPIATTKSPTLELVEVAESGHRGQMVAGELEHRDIGLGIAPDELCGEAAVVLGGDGDRGLVGDDMRIGQHIALRRIDDDPRAGRLELALLVTLAVGDIEEAAEERVLQERGSARARGP